MTEWFPSEEWLSRYRENLNGSERYREASDGWGVDFAGDFVFEIRNLPLEETTLAAFPDGLTDGVRENLDGLGDDRAASLVEGATPTLRSQLPAAGDDRERLESAILATTVADVPEAVWPAFRNELPANLVNLLDQLERYVEDGTVRAYLDLRDGECREAVVLDPAEDVDPGFALAGPYGQWKALTEGADVMDSVLGEALELEGSVTRVIDYADAADEMGVVASRTESTPLFDAPG